MIALHAVAAALMLYWSVTAADMWVSIGAMACGIMSLAVAAVAVLESEERRR